MFTHLGEDDLEAWIVHTAAAADRRMPALQRACVEGAIISAASVPRPTAACGTSSVPRFEACRGPMRAAAAVRASTGLLQELLGEARRDRLGAHLSCSSSATPAASQSRTGTLPPVHGTGTVGMGPAAEAVERRRVAQRRNEFLSHHPIHDTQTSAASRSPPPAHAPQQHRRSPRRPSEPDEPYGAAVVSEQQAMLQQCMENAAELRRERQAARRAFRQDRQEALHQRQRDAMRQRAALEVAFEEVDADTDARLDHIAQTRSVSRHRHADSSAAVERERAEAGASVRKRLARGRNLRGRIDAAASAVTHRYVRHCRSLHAARMELVHKAQEAEKARCYAEVQARSEQDRALIAMHRDGSVARARGHQASPLPADPDM